MLPLLLLLAQAAGPEATPALCNVERPPYGSWLLATAVVPLASANAQEQATRQARAKLLEQLCSGEDDCEQLQPLIRDWKAARSSEAVCATVAMDEAEYEKWKHRKQAARAAFSQGLGAAVQRAVGELKRAGAPKGGPSVLLTEVHDDGSVGGQRSRWARLQLASAVDGTGVAIKPLPERWSGRGVPPEVSGVVRAYLTTVDDQVSELAVELESRERVVPSEPFRFSHAIAPAPLHREAGPGAAATVDPRLRLRLETKTGDFCDGQRTQLWLDSDKRRCVLVFDAWGPTATLLFPNEAHPSCFVEGKQRGGGDEGFNVVALPGIDEERFIALAAESPALLPAPLRRFAQGSRALSTCRLAGPQLRALDERGTGPVVRSELRLRLLKNDPAACADVPAIDPVEYQQYLDLAKGLAACPAR